MKKKGKFYIETYGCQMNFSDTEIIASVLSEHDYLPADNIHEADYIFLNTCSIRDHAEKRVLNRLDSIQWLKKKNPSLIIGVLGCMAERLKEELLNQKGFVDVIVGPDAYRDLPKLLETAGNGQKEINVMLSAEETYADIRPVRMNSDRVTAFISIMRGCANHCSYCVVPEVRGKERSRDIHSILREAEELFQQGYREITLLGQNVNSYAYVDGGEKINFAFLLDAVAKINPQLRVRFATSHPKDLSDDLLKVMAAHENICRCIHLPLQSGSSRILKLMNRNYTKEYYLNRIEAIRKIIPECAITTDIIAGFCTETEEDHRQTLEVMKTVAFEYAYMFKYSERPGTPAAKRLKDDVPDSVKSRRLKEIIDLQQELSLKSNQKDVGKTFLVLAEKFSKRSREQLSGRTSQNKTVVFPAGNMVPGNYVNVKITHCTAATLLGVASNVS